MLLLPQDEVLRLVDRAEAALDHDGDRQYILEQLIEQLRDLRPVGTASESEQLHRWREAGRQVLFHAQEEWDVDIDAFDGTVGIRDLLNEVRR